MSKYTTVVSVKDSFNLSKGRDGFWLYDETLGMNLSMRALSEVSAFMEALDYYQKRLKTVEKELCALHSKVENFVAQFTEDDDNCDCNN
jgi:hypothetical protein